MAERWINLVVKALLAVLVGMRVDVDVHEFEGRTSITLWTYERNMAVKDIMEKAFAEAAKWGFEVIDCSAPFTSMRTEDGHFYSIKVMDMSAHRNKEFAHKLVSVIS